LKTNYNVQDNSLSAEELWLRHASMGVTIHAHVFKNQTYYLHPLTSDTVRQRDPHRVQHDYEQHIDATASSSGHEAAPWSQHTDSLGLDVHNYSLAVCCTYNRGALRLRQQ